jgi:UDP-glucose 4-epimerase
MSKKKNVLVTGAAGFIGSFVVDECIRLGFNVIALDDLSGGFVNNVHLKSKFVRGSISNIKLIDSLFKRYRFTYVYHLAAYAAEGLSHFIKRFNYENNLIGSVNLINASINWNVKCFVFTSSIAVYGRNQLPMREDMMPEPEDPYGIAKFAVEQELKVSHDMFGLNYVIFRPHNVYGERQNVGDKYRNVIGIFMNQILNSKPLTIFGDGKQKRAFTYIGDIAPIIAKSPLVKKAYGETFNVGADKAHNVNTLAVHVAAAMGQGKHPVRYLPPRNEVKNAFSDHSKSERVFHHRAQYSLEAGLAKMAAWVKHHGAKKSKEFAKVEVEKNLPVSWRKKKANR